jgi:hypothetical protein
LADLDATWRAAKAADEVPEPSPLFWEHFSARVREATRDESVAGSSFWGGAWRPIAAFGALAAVVALVVALRVFPRSDGSSLLSVDPVDAPRSDSLLPNAVDDASAVSPDEIRQVVASSWDPPAAVNVLTVSEREVFVRLLEVEMGRTQ